MEISTLSTEFIKIQVAATINGVLADPTGDAVAMAFLASGVQPVDADWQTGSWESSGTDHWARCLVGPDGGTITLAKGQYRVWLRVTDNPEVPVKMVGTLSVY